MSEEPLTPGEVAQNEIAKQTVMLVFGLVTAVIVMRLQSRMFRQMTEDRGPDAERTRRMEDAKRTAEMWDRAAGWTVAVAKRFWRLSDKARAAYEAERP